jgi:hypothetical protein
MPTCGGSRARRCGSLGGSHDAETGTVDCPDTGRSEGTALPIPVSRNVSRNESGPDSALPGAVTPKRLDAMDDFDFLATLRNTVLHLEGATPRQEYSW